MGGRRAMAPVWSVLLLIVMIAVVILLVYVLPGRGSDGDADDACDEVTVFCGTPPGGPAGTEPPASIETPPATSEAPEDSESSGV